ncbi:MAG: hypothetical protein COZ23_08490 [Hydrogenophilales bacterium CG_4_10_14_3_um_filter_58_23]|nr:MAG: hypothetical protein COZ23_08490 [Hydrogenophilales bacterium CG_4_10_14_3_um_filter_58_23]
MKFRSNSNEDVYLALTSGQTAIVTVAPCVLDERFHKEAIANGCLPEGVNDTPEDDTPSFDRKQVIVDALNAMLSGSNEEDFTAQGKPAIGKLCERVGFTVSRSEADAIWDEMSK